MKNLLEEIKNSPNYPRLKKIQDKKLEIIMNKNSGEELELELDELIELVEESERERIIEDLPKKMEVDNTDDDYVRHMAGGYNQAINDIIKIINQ